MMRHATTLRRTLVLFAVGCIGVIDPASASAQGPAPGAATQMPPGVRTSQLPDGSMLLTDAKGMTLYTFVKDTPQQSNCTGACATLWPPLMVAEDAAAAGDWTIVTREDGSRQWAYRGMPLYGWIKDARPGDLTGDGVGGAWKVAAAGAAPSMVRVHLAHVTPTFLDTPRRQGLMATAVAEARIAAQHAALAARSGDDLDAMKLHAGHVIHAVDPRIEPKGPGLGYGVKRAAAGVVEHMQLAAKVPSASNNVLTHAAHILASASNVVKRADEMVAVARRIRAAATAAEAAPHVSHLNMLAQQLTSGLDVNGDGQIGWQTGEGGLEQAQIHMQLMLKGEGT